MFRASYVFRLSNYPFYNRFGLTACQRNYRIGTMRILTFELSRSHHRYGIAFGHSSHRLEWKS